MDAHPLTVVAILQAKPGQEEPLRQALLGLIPASRQDAGCLSYHLHEDLDKKGAFLFLEQWTSKQHLDDHLARPHVQDVFARIPELCSAPPDLSLWHKIG